MLQPAGPFDPLFPALLAGLLVLLNRKQRRLRQCSSFQASR
jgi:hypothetical protein